MKERPMYFLAEDKIDQDGEIFDYIRELHGYLWRFVYIFNPVASGSLSDFIDSALSKGEGVERQDAIISLRQALTDVLRYVEAIEAWAKMVEKKHYPTQICPSWGDKVATEEF